MSNYDKSLFMEKSPKWIDFSNKSVPKFHYTEILAPSSAVSYKYAINGGADAIYFGYKELNARASAENFESLKEIVEYCHSYRVKAYLALNIELKNSELERAKEIIIEAEEADIDAFIITDLSLVSIIKKYSKAQIHASTQMGVHNVLGAQFLKRFGFDRVVLSREATLRDIADIKSNVDIEVEVFVQGALCVAFSGACLLSSILTGNSGNRGRCNQLCRQYYHCQYKGKEIAEGYLLSAKDMCMLDNIDDLIELKVDSFKIEGRLRRNEYVALSTKIYKDAVYEGIDVVQSTDELKRLYNRGNYTNGYFDGNDIIYPFIPNHIGVKSGIIVKVLSRNECYAKLSGDIERGDCFKVIRAGLEVGGARASGEKYGNQYLLSTDCDVRVGDQVNITTDVSLNAKSEECKSLIEVQLAIRIVANEPIHALINAFDVTTERYFDDIIPQKALSKPLSEADICEQLSKMGGTKYYCKEPMKIITDGVFLPKSSLNEIRRRLIDALDKDILNSYSRKLSFLESTDLRALPERKEKTKGNFAEIDSVEKLVCAEFKHISNIVYSPAVFNLTDATEFFNTAKKTGKVIFIKPPIFINSENSELITKIADIFDGIIANNLGMVELACKLNKKVIAGINLNITNGKNPLIKICDGYVASVELNKKEFSLFKDAICYAYGYLPLMNLSFCPRHLVGLECGDCEGELTYSDNKAKYPITDIRVNAYCQHVLHNGVLTNIGNNVIKNAKYFDFTLTKPEEMTIILENYSREDYTVENSNKLHLSRGVE